MEVSSVKWSISQTTDANTAVVKTLDTTKRRSPCCKGDGRIDLAAVELEELPLF